MAEGLVLLAGERKEGCYKISRFCIRINADPGSSTIRSKSKSVLLHEVALSSHLGPNFQFCANLQKNQYPSQCCTFLNSCGFPRISAGENRQALLCIRSKNKRTFFDQLSHMGWEPIAHPGPKLQWCRERGRNPKENLISKSSPTAFLPACSC